MRDPRSTENEGAAAAERLQATKSTIVLLRTSLTYGLGAPVMSATPANVPTASHLSADGSSLEVSVCDAASLAAWW